jgi:transposase
MWGFVVDVMFLTGHESKVVLERTMLRIFAAIEPVDARKSFDGLAAVVRDSLGGDPMTGHMFFFLNRRGDMAQILFWDRTGFVVMRKRLEAGTFRLVRNADGNKSSVEIDAVELGLMLEGIDLGTVKRRKRFKMEPQSTIEEKSATT